MKPMTVAAAAFVCAALFAGAPAHAASVPAWLDEGISVWNEANPADAIRFVNIKDSYVWYDMPKSAEISQKMIRERYDVSSRTALAMRALFEGYFSFCDIFRSRSR